MRVFFNEYGQKLNSSIVEISGIEEIKKVPSGIRKNFLVQNLFSGIDAFGKYYTSEGEPSQTTQKLIDGLNSTKAIVKKIVNNQGLHTSDTVGFVFTEDYKFITLVDGHNKSISNKELYIFLKDRVKLNQYISTLNSINCQLVGDAIGKSVINVGAPPSNYNHFVSNPRAKVKKSKKKQVI